MRLRVTLLGIGVAIAALLPLLSAAATSPSAAVAGANIAPNTPSDAKACILKLFQAQNQKNASAGKPAGATTDGLKDTCTSENVSVDASGKKTITQTGRVGNNDLTNGCTADSCSAPKCGIVTVTISLPGSPSQTKTISKCDPNFQKDLSSASGNTADAMKNFALQSLAQSAIQNANPGTATGADQLTQALTKFGVSADDAQKVVSDDAANGTSNSKDLLSAFISQDPNQISQAATTAGITLNQDTINNITSLTPSQVSSNVSSLYTPDQQNSADNIANSPSTFAAPDASAQQSQPLKGGQYASMIAATEQQYNVPAGVLGSMCQSESHCTPNICYQNNPNNACGMYQYTPATWTSTTYQMCQSGQIDASQCTANGSVPLSGRLDPTLSTQVAAYSVSQNLAQYGSLIAQTGIDQGTAAYIMQGLGTPTAAKFFQAYINNPNMSTADLLYQVTPSNAASIIANNGNLYNGQTLQGTVNQFAANLGAAPSGASVASADTAAGIASPFSASPSIYSSTPLGSSGSSPFSGVSSIPGAGSSQSASYSQPNQYSQGTQYTSNSSGGTTQTTSNSSTGVTQTGHTGTAVAQLIAQPQTLSRGGIVTVSWSSAGMSSVTPCTVTENGTSAIATANEGSKQLSATTAGTMKFSLSCTAQGTSAIVTGSSVVSVQ
jgi:hypothetical protein